MYKSACVRAASCRPELYLPTPPSTPTPPPLPPSLPPPPSPPLSPPTPHPPLPPSPPSTPPLPPSPPEAGEQQLEEQQPSHVRAHPDAGAAAPLEPQQPCDERHRHQLTQVLTRQRLKPVKVGGWVGVLLCVCDIRRDGGWVGFGCMCVCVC